MMRKRTVSVSRSFTPISGGSWAGAAIFLLLALAGCSERNLPTEVESHGSDWNKISSSDFHGNRVVLFGPDGCEACHGGDWRGRGEAPSCYECHEGPGGHPSRWMDESSTRFHGKAVEQSGPSPCAACHGDDFRGGWSGVSCDTCHGSGPSGHPDGWVDVNSPAFHGIEVEGGGIDDCTRCHGSTLAGGTSGVGCGDCHPGF